MALWDTACGPCKLEKRCARICRPRLSSYCVDLTAYDDRLAGRIGKIAEASDMKGLFAGRQRNHLSGILIYVH